MTDETSKPEEEMSEDELIDAAMAALSGDLPTTTEEEEEPPTAEQQQAEPETASEDQDSQPAPAAPPQAVEMTPEMEAALSSTSPTLGALEENRRPSQKTVCD